MHFIRLVISVILYYSGFLKLYLILRKRLGLANKIKILAYHSISDQPDYLNLSIPVSIFESHLVYLKNTYHVISLEQALELIGKGGLSNDIIVITFDDGYRDNYLNAFPLIKKFSIPVTIFLTVSPIQQRKPLFIDALMYAIQCTPHSKLDLQDIGLGIFDIKSHKAKTSTIDIINEYSKTINEGEREVLLRAIFEKLNIEINSPYLNELMLTWNDIRDMNNHGISFGSHTLSHPVLSRIDTTRAWNEISESKSIIEKEIGKKVKAFGYPYGSIQDISTDIIELVKRADYECALTLMHGINNSNSNLFALKRIMIGNNVISKFQFLSRSLFAAEVSGIFDILFLRNVRKRDDAIG